MNREIERGNNINLTNLLTRLGNVFPPEQGQQADATLHQVLLAATMCTSQRDIPRRSEPKDQPISTNTESRASRLASQSASTTTRKENQNHGIGYSRTYSEP